MIGKDPTEIKKRQEEKKRRLEEINALRDELKNKIEEKGYDLKKMFELFDKNGDGVFV